MRIISGSARGKKLKEFKGNDIRPTSDRVREALFSSLQCRFGLLSDLRVLDLYAGTGSLGLEALSRGANEACFVDLRPESCRILRDNIESCRFKERAKVINADACSAIESYRLSGSFDIIFLDPPYSQDLVPRTLKTLADSKLVGDQTLIIAETEAKELLEALDTNWVLESSRKYGRTLIHFIRRSPER